MKVSSYLVEIRHAAETVLAELYRERAELARLSEELRQLTAGTEDGYQRAEFLANNPDLDDEGLGTAIYWDTYFGVDKERFQKNKEMQDATARLSAHEFSLAELSGSLLQYAKRGLSLRFGPNKTGAPAGRQIHGLDLSEVIWQGRNQAIHWEDGSFHKATEACFKQLAAANSRFVDYRKRSMAFDVIDVLGWRTFADFERDMLLLDI